ncbi:MAG TPA: macrolide ABC transporter ATP-binding protein, partial [Acidobacteria bacterium]|nr:macrolide ABC transporter ATP-binding protein [Acidobacteriota bacterium]
MTPDDTRRDVRTDNLWKIYQQASEEVHAVREVTLTIQPGEFTALAGPSGSGKTTLLNLIGGLTRPTRGQVRVGDHELSTLPNHELARLRLEQIGFIFQAYNLLPVLTARENAE